MADYEFKLPDIGEGVSEGEIVEWHVNPGDQVGEDDPMVEVMTDKATVTIGAPKAGTIKDLRYNVGDTAEVGSVIVVLDVGGASAEAGAREQRGEPAAAASSGASPARAAPGGGDGGERAATAVGDIREGLPGSSYFSRGAAARTNGNGAGPAAPAPQEPEADRGAAARPSAASGGGAATQQVEEYFQPKPLATPSTRKLARDLSVDLRKVRPSGPGGRVLREDVEAFARHGAAPAGPSAQPQPAAQPTAARRPPARIEAAGGDEALEERKPFVGLRRKIAERMQTAKNTAAHFTFVEECDVGRLKELRGRLKPHAEEQGIRLSFLPFIVKAVVAALKRHPVLNSALDEATNELVYRRYYHIGVATATDAGLMVPVVRDADRRSITDIATELERLARGAREGGLSPQELSGSTFTITSLGKQGGLFATPVLNHPEVGILGVHQMKQKPVVRDGEIVVGDVMLLSLSFDHRIVDGHVGAAFAYELIGYLEEPGRLFLEMA